MTRSIEAIFTHGTCVQLRPQQRVSLPPAEKVVLLREGMLAIDAMPIKEKLQILDFLVAGDVVSASIVLATPGVSLRAITSTTLISLDPLANDCDVPAHEYRTFLMAQCRNQLARVNIYQLMIGRLETEPRVASFLLGLALRNSSGDAPDLTIALPMSRTDIANYLVINSDTLSRTMMRFRALGLIERAGRHAVRVIDLDGLRKKSPLAPLLAALLEKGSSQFGDFARHAERTRPYPPTTPIVS
jgi:CRP/FNR family transcriptional regulator